MRFELELQRPAAFTAVAVLISCASIVGPSAVQAASCDCSCEALNGQKARMAELGRNNQFTEVQAAMACVNNCRDAWADCHATERADEKAARNAARQQRAGERADQFTRRLGTPRNDLARFYGQYEAGRGLTYSVQQLQRPGNMDAGHAPGYMMIVPNKAGPPPLWLRSVTDNRFEADINPPGTTATVEFELDDAERATAMILTSPYADEERYPRTGDPEDTK